MAYIIPGSFWTRTRPPKSSRTLVTRYATTVKHIKNNQIASQLKSPTVTQLFGDVTPETCVTDTHIIFHDVLTFSVHAYTVVLHPCVVFAFIDVYKKKSDIVNIYMINLISRHYRNNGRLPIYNFTVVCLVARPLNENEALSWPCFDRTLPVFVIWIMHFSR